MSLQQHLSLQQHRARSLALFFLAASISQLGAQEPSAGSVDEARYNAVVQEAENEAELTFATLPPIKDTGVRTLILRYNRAARGWWAGMHCKFGETAGTKRFEANLTLFTNTMDMVFAKEFQKMPREGNAHSQTVQMYALNALSAKKFYECSQKANDIWLVGQEEAERVGDFLRKTIDKVDREKNQPSP